MFVLSKTTEPAYRVLAMLVAAAIVLATAGFNLMTAEAANLTNISDTLTDSNPSSNSNHEIYFEVPVDDGTGLQAGDTLVVTFDPDGQNFDLTGIVAGDIDLLVGETGQDLTGVEWSVAVNTVADTITFTSVTGTIAEGASTTILIGTNATGGSNQINNPGVVDDYEIVVNLAPGGASPDTGRTRVAIVDNVLVTATVDTVFEFTVSGFPTITGVGVNGTSTTGTSSATELPFGTLAAGAVETLAQRLNVNTNAANGFVVTVQTDGAFQSSTGADIDSFANAGDTATPLAWLTNQPTRSITGAPTDENTWGHWGVTSADDTANAGAPFGANNFIAASTSPRTVFEHDGPADSTIDDIGSTTVGYQVQITSLQEAGDDYEVVLTYIATPTF